MPDRTYTAADVAALLKSVSDGKDTSPWTPEDIDRQLEYALPVPPQAAQGERVLKSGVEGLPDGSRAVSIPSRVFESEEARGPSITVGRGEMVGPSMEFGEGEMVPSAEFGERRAAQPQQGASNPMQELGGKRFNDTQPPQRKTMPVVKTPSGDYMDAGQFRGIINNRMERNMGWERPSQSQKPKSETLEYLLSRSKGK